jgi:hypothetical protein
LVVVGWALDKPAGRPPASILVFDRGRFLGIGRPSVPRPDLAKKFGTGAMRAGFRIELLSGRPKTLAVAERLALVAVSARHAWRLRPLPNVFARG